MPLLRHLAERFPCPLKRSFLPVPGKKTGKLGLLSRKTFILKKNHVCVQNVRTGVIFGFPYVGAQPKCEFSLKGFVGVWGLFFKSVPLILPVVS